jgi:predicted secreted protein
MMRLTRAITAAMLAITGMAAQVQADEDLRYNQVRLQAEQSEAVSNDTMHVTLSTFAESRDPADLATAINRDMDWALQIARSVEGVDASTGGYQTYPVHKDNVIKSWRGQQNLMLEGLDHKAIGRLVGTLQERLQVKSMQFSVSDDRRRAVENRLIGRALDAFRERAGIVGSNLDAKGYRIVELNINTGSQRPPVPYQARMAAMEAAAPVVTQAGDSDVRVTISGTVELQLP